MCSSMRSQFAQSLMWVSQNHFFTRMTWPYTCTSYGVFSDGAINYIKDVLIRHGLIGPLHLSRFLLNSKMFPLNCNNCEIDTMHRK